MWQDDDRKDLHATRQRTLRHHAHRPRERQGRDLPADEQGRREQALRQARLHHFQPAFAGGDRVTLELVQLPLGA